MTTTVSSARSEPDDGIGWAEVVVPVLRRRKLFVWLPFALVVLLVGGSLFLRRTWTSVATFYPQQSPGLSSRLAGLASQLGVSIPGQDQTLSPDFFAQVASSPTVLSAVASRRYPVPGDPDCPCTLSTFWGITDASADVRLARAQLELRDHIRVIPGALTGSVGIEVSTESPAMSAELNAALLSEISRVNDEVRAGRARAERQFVAGRMVVAESSLAVAEHRAEVFLNANREYQNSPALTFEWQRLNSDVALYQGLIATLSQEYENAGIEAVRNTPSLAVPQMPTMPAIPDRRWLVVKALGAIIVGWGLATGLAIGEHLVFRDGRAERPTPEDARMLVRETWILLVRTIASPFQRMRHLGGRNARR